MPEQQKQFKIDPNYVDVPHRIAEFREKYPEGSLQPASVFEPYKIEVVGQQTFIVYAAAAYRTPDDIRPGIGVAWEPCPGKTPYTKDSELQNAETSAWGRAIVAALAADTHKGIASAEEVRNRQADPETGEIPTNRARPNQTAATVPAAPDSAPARRRPPPAGAPSAAQPVPEPLAGYPALVNRIASLPPPARAWIRSERVACGIPGAPVDEEHLFALEGLVEAAEAGDYKEAS